MQYSTAASLAELHRAVSLPRRRTLVVRQTRSPLEPIFSTLGRHTDEILSAPGFDAASIAAMRAEGACA